MKTKEKNKKYKKVLEKIREILNKDCGIITNAKVVGIINETLEYESEEECI